ncbi:Tudor domain-containing protein 3 [Argiope bruennichi]|uniref:Tudor domain-containing protein 3 n=1 Tax=Argiope bruennichi TaxID=94029 RepID=A0A8T0E7I2_ARGBR|nr:Tudor domain-containing protein 3 [Argiope bruennichi]
MKAAKLESISGPGVVQIQKIKNASAPKYEYGSGAPPILRLLLTDGNTFVNCLQWGAWKSVSMDTPPGTKIYLKPGKIMMQNSFMLLSETQFTFLGGCVAPMVEKWELCKRLASHVRTKENLDGTGPPPWIPFGKPINTTKTKTIHAVGKEGTTCVVHFMEYGNYEEVLIDDVQPLQVHTGHSGWDAGPISFRPSHWENNRNQDFPPISEFHHNSNRSHSQQHGHQERQRTPRQDRPSAKLYQPPHQRQTS